MWHSPDVLDIIANERYSPNQHGPTSCKEHSMTWRVLFLFLIFILFKKKNKMDDRVFDQVERTSSGDVNIY